MTIHQLLNDQQASVLGPVTVKKDWGLNQKTRTPLRSILVEDSSHPDGIVVKLWGAPANSPFTVGQTITLRCQPGGDISTEEYNGKTNVKCNKVNVEIGGEAATAQQQHQPPTGQPAQSRPTPNHLGLDSRQLARNMAEFTRDLSIELKKAGVPDQLRLKMVERAPEFGALWWFGQKTVPPSRPVVQSPPAQPQEPETVSQPQTADQGEIPGEDPDDAIPF